VILCFSEEKRSICNCLRNCFIMKQFLLVTVCGGCGFRGGKGFLRGVAIDYPFTVTSFAVSTMFKIRSRKSS